MNKVKIYEAENEPVLGYKKGSKERLNVEKTYNCLLYTSPSPRD